jgi:hypothetical protein
MAPFIAHLSTGYRDCQLDTASADFAAIEGKAARPGFAVDRMKIPGDGGERLRMLPESSELRVVSIATSVAAQYRLRQQGLAPQRHQALRIEIFGMQGPKTHRSIVL